jgi:hypothetical protein
VYVVAFNMQFKLTAIFFGALAAGSTAAFAQPPQDVIDKCMKAADFEGCVNVLTGKSSKPMQPAETKVTVDIDKLGSTGNACPSGMAYLGGGYCQQWTCSPRHENDSRLAGKEWGCGAGTGGGFFTRGGLIFEGLTVRAITNEKCPLEEPEIGRSSSCANGLSERELRSGIVMSRVPPRTEVNDGTWLHSCDGDAFEIIYVDPGSPADKAGLIIGDRVLSVDGMRCDEFRRMSFKAGEQKDFLVERDGEEPFVVPIVYELYSQPEIITKVDTKTGKWLFNY